MAYFIKHNNNVFSYNGVIFKAGELTESQKGTFKTHPWVNITSNVERLVYCDDSRLYFSNQYTKEIEIYSLSNLSMITSFGTKNANAPSGVAGSPLTGLIYVLSGGKLQTYNYSTFAYIDEYNISGNAIDIDESNDRIAIGMGIRKLSDLSLIGSVSGGGGARLDKLGGRIFVDGVSSVNVFDYDTFAMIDTITPGQMGSGASGKMGDTALGNGWIFYQYTDVSYAPANNPSAGIIGKLYISTTGRPKGVAYDKTYNRIFSAGYGNAQPMVVTQYLFK